MFFSEFGYMVKNTYLNSLECSACTNTHAKLN